MFSWILTIGLAIMIPLMYLNTALGLFILSLIFFVMYVGFDCIYTEEVKSGPYIVQEVQGLGEKMIFYYEDVNIFIMKRSHEEMID